jgi:hypothetical protein
MAVTGVLGFLPLQRQIEHCADLTGRIRRHLPEDAVYIRYLLDELADGLEVLDAMSRPSAAEMYRIYVKAGIETAKAAHDALDVVDRRRRRFRHLVGVDA